MKRAGLIFTLLLLATSASALTLQDVITGADMAGMKVTATFADNSSETATWVTTSTDATVPDGEGFAGEAAGVDWSLAQQGYTLGNCLDASCSVLGGVWTLKNTGTKTIVELAIDALAGDIVFDLDLDNVHTPGSNIGREFVADDTTNKPSSYVYSVPVSSPDLWGALTLKWDPASTAGFGPNDTLRFMADTDKIVPEPPLYALLALGLLGAMWGIRRLRA